MKQKLFVILLAVFAVTQVNAQEEMSDEPVKGFDKSRLFFGGNFGASFGDYTLVNVSPQLGYRFSNFFAAGAGVNFIYTSFKQRDLYNDPIYRDNYGVAGLNIFGRVYPINVVMLQVQPEMNYTWGKRKYFDGLPETKLPNKFVPSLLLGAGAAIPSGPGAFMIMMQYDVLQNVRSPYGTRPFLSFGYNMGF